MQTTIEILRPMAALIVGTIIGYCFGFIQDLAQRRNQQKEREGQVKNVWSLMPGSGVRVAYLLITLVVIQIVCPMLFAEGTQWWVSGGVVGGYGLILYRQLRERRAVAR